VRLVAAGVTLAALGLLGVRLIAAVGPFEPVSIDLRSWFDASSLTAFAPHGPSVLRGESLLLAKRLLAGLVMAGALWMIWLHVRVFRLESRLADTSDRGTLAFNELREQRSRYRELIEAASEFSYRHAIDGSSLWLDERGLRLFGYSEADLTWLKLSDLLGEDALPVVQRQLDRVNAGAANQASQELLLRTKDGRPLWIEGRARAVRRGGGVVAIEGVARDITARRVDETKAAVQRGIMRAIAEAASLESSYQRVIATLCGELHWDYGEIWWIDESYEVLRAVAASWSEPGESEPVGEVRKRTLGRGASLPGRCWSTGAVLHVSDASSIESDPWLRDLAMGRPFREVLVLPVQRSGRVLGVLALLSRRERARPWSPMDVLDAVGDHLGALAERERTRDALRISEARKHAMLESASDCVISVDHQGRIIEFNPASERTFRYQRGEVLGEPVFAVIVPEDLRARAAEAFRAFQTSSAAPFGGRRVEFEAMRSDGSRVPIEISISLIHVGDLPFFTGYLRDITERKQVDQMKDELVSTVSHELRTPLSSMRGFVELLLMRDHRPDEAHRFLEIVDKEMRRLSKLIDDFLDVQRIEAGGLDYDFELQDLRELVEEATSLCAASTDRHAFSLDLAAEPIPVRVDPDRMRQVLRNLLSNAVKYSPDGGTVTVTVRNEAERACLAVRDQGIGMDDQTLAQLFRKFFRADNTATRRIGGTGLGLALVREIVAAHGGEVRVESRPGEGSEFIVSLPRVTAPPEERERV
jgi:PAS domain S-box-containing protein